MPEPAFKVARRVLSEDAKVPYGIFGVIESSGFFPPRSILNEFLMVGNDPCDQDGRMAKWSPISLSSEEYSALKEWWISIHPDAVEASLDADNWHDWIQVILDM